MAKKKKRKRNRGAAPASRPVTANIRGDFYQNGEDAFRVKDYAAAVKAWRSEIRANPDADLAKKLAEAHFRYALSMDRERKLTQVISELHQASQQAPDVAIYRYHLGLAYHQKKQYDRAITAYRQALELRPGDERFQTHLALAYAESGQDVRYPVASVMQSVQQEKYAEARETLKNCSLGEIHGVVAGCVSAILGKSPEAKRQLNRYTATEHGALSSYYLGLLYAQEGKVSSAIKHLETATNDPYMAAACEPILLGIYKQRAAEYTEAGDHAKANRFWNKIAQLDPQDTAADNAIATSLQEGMRQASEGNLSQAMRSWRRLINQGIEHPALLQNYAIACDQSGSYENAMNTWQTLATVWERQLSTAPNRERFKLKLALVYRRIGEIALRLDDAELTKDVYQKALTFAPEDVEIRTRLVTLLAEEGDLNTARRQFRQLRRRYPNDIRVLELEIILGLESEDFDKALNACVGILKVDPKHRKSLELLESLGSKYVQELRQKNQHRQVIRMLQSFIEVYPNHPSFYMMLGGTLLEQKRTAEGDRVLANAIELAENKNQVHAKVGAAYLCAAYTERAESHFEAAGGLDSEQPDILLIIGVAYIPFNAQKSDLYFNRLIAVKPEDETVFETIAQAFVKSGMPDRALEMLNRGLKKFPNSITLLIASISAAIAMDDFSLARKTLKKTRKLARAALDFEALQALSTLEMMLSFQNFGGGIDEFRDTGKSFFGKPF